jgi:hypothetical protein
MALVQNPNAQNNKVRIKTLRRWQNVTRDSDGNPDNGITVNRAKLASTIAQPADWSQVSNVQLAAMLTDGASGLRSESQARTHLSSQLAGFNKDPQMTLVGRYASGGTVAAP